MQTGTDVTYQQQLDEKTQRLTSLLAPFNAPELAVFPSEEQHYRMRAEFRVWHDGDDLYHIMFNPVTKEKYRVDTFAPASRDINDMMSRLMEALRNNPVMRKKLFQVDYLGSLSGDMVISLLYHRPLNDEWDHAASALQAELSKDKKVNLIGRARKQKRIIGNDFVIEKLPVNDQEFIFKHIENSFTQPNANVNCKMIEWTLDVTRPLKGDLLELYCGCGNFSLPLAKQFDRVVGTEIAKPSVQAAQYNIDRNGLTNVDIVRLSAEEFTEALLTGREFNRLNGIELGEYNFSTVLVDPPRAGLDLDSLKMIQHYDNIIYISCNPDTLSDNLKTLCTTHEISDAALFDQFPFTHHIETGVVLRKKS